MQLLIVKLGGLCWIWFEECTGLWKLLSLYSTDCSYTSGMSMKKHSGSLVSKPGEKNNTEFTALEIGRKNQIHKVSLDRWTHRCNTGWVFRGAADSICVFCQLYKRNNFHPVYVLGHICTLNKQITHRLYSIFYKYHQNQLKSSKWRLIKKMLWQYWSRFSGLSGAHVVVTCSWTVQTQTRTKQTVD